MDKIKKITMLWVLLCVPSAYCQHDNIWYFGRWCGLNFSSGSPVAITNSAMSPLEGSTAMCDSNGNLLFYSNGASLYNANHQALQNGSGIKGDHSSTESSLAIPKPGQPGHYYLFVTDDAAGINGLTYSEIDMAGANGLGTVINKNVQLVAPTCEKLTAAYHANGNDVWITTHHWGSNAFYSYLVTVAGVNPVPVISNVGAVLDGANNSGKFSGHMAISSTGTHLAIANNFLNVQLFSFDNATGIISNPVTLRNAVNCYGIEFSASGNVLYVTSEKKLLQYTINAPDIAATETLITNLPQSGTIRLAPDGKIYVVEDYFSTKLSVINNPDVIGSGCNYLQNRIDLAGRQTFVGLPSYLASNLYITAVTSSGTCQGNAVSFTFTATKTPDTVTWDFGDGSISSDFNPLHVYSTAGTYTVKTRAQKGYMVRFNSRTVTVLQAPQANQPQDIAVCGDSNSAAFNLRQQDIAILGPNPPAGTAITYHASLPDAEAAANALPDIFYSANGGTVYARVSNGTCYTTTTFKLIVNPTPVFTMQDVYIICSGPTATISAPSGFDSYLWSTGQLSNTIQVATGNYTLTVFKGQCGATVPFMVQRSGAPVIREIKTSDWTDNNNSIHIVAEGDGNFEYSIDGTKYQSSPVFNNLEPGLYSVQVKDANGCGQAKKDIALLMYPRYFTPNGDGINEYWQVKFAHFEPGLKVYIYDRYGKLITGFPGNTTGWDGKFNGHDVFSNDYWFTAIRANGREYRGHFSLVR